MKCRSLVLALLPLALVSCTTTGGGDPLSQRWNGVEAGTFFSKYVPPQEDSSVGGKSAYTWRGGYARRTTPAVYEKGEDGKNGKLISHARSESLSCGVEIQVDGSYRISSIRATIDNHPENGGPSYCEEFLDAAKASDKK